MNLDLVNNIFKEVKNNKFVQNFINELQNYLESNISKNSYIDIEKEDISLVKPTHNGNKIIAKYRDKMYEISILNCTLHTININSINSAVSPKACQPIKMIRRKLIEFIPP